MPSTLNLDTRLEGNAERLSSFLFKPTSSFKVRNSFLKSQQWTILQSLQSQQIEELLLIWTTTPLLKIRSFLSIQIDERMEKRNDPPKLQTLALKTCPFGLALINHFGWQTKMSKCHKKRCHPPNYFFPFCPYNFLVLSLLTMPYIIFGMH